MKQQRVPEGGQQLSASAALLEVFDDAVLTTDLFRSHHRLERGGSSRDRVPADVAVGVMMRS